MSDQEKQFERMSLEEMLRVLRADEEEASKLFVAELEAAPEGLPEKTLGLTLG